MDALVREFADEWKPDRTVAFTFVMGAYALRANRASNIIDVDNFMSQMMFEAYKEAEDVRTKVRRYLAWRKFLNYEKWLYDQYDRCLVVTDKDRDSLCTSLG